MFSLIAVFVLPAMGVRVGLDGEAAVQPAVSAAVRRRLPPSTAVAALTAHIAHPGVMMLAVNVEQDAG
jgi:hypothetical protein